jgi:hypothetical protein
MNVTLSANGHGVAETARNFRDCVLEISAALLLLLRTTILQGLRGNHGSCQVRKSFAVKSSPTVSPYVLIDVGRFHSSQLSFFIVVLKQFVSWQVPQLPNSSRQLRVLKIDGVLHSAFYRESRIGLPIPEH